MIQTSTRKKCGNCKHFELSPPVAPTSKSTYFGRCKRPDWQHATSIGKVCPGHKARVAVVSTATSEHVQNVTSAIWYAFSVLTEHRYTDAAEALEYAAKELRAMAARREVRK